MSSVRVPLVRRSGDEGAVVSEYGEGMVGGGRWMNRVRSAHGRTLCGSRTWSRIFCGILSSKPQNGAVHRRPEGRETLEFVPTLHVQKSNRYT